MTGDIWKEFNKELLGFIKARVNNSENAEDILQEVFIKIHKNVSSIQEGKKTASWVYQITRNTIIDFYRKKKKDYTDYIFEKSLPEDIDYSTTDFIKCLKPFILQLPEKDKDILLKTTFENISQKQYALDNNLTYSTVKSRVQRARKQLKKMFVKCCNIEADKYGNIISSRKKECDC